MKNKGLFKLALILLFLCIFLAPYFYNSSGPEIFLFYLGVVPIGIISLFIVLFSLFSKEKVLGEEKGEKILFPSKIKLVAWMLMIIGALEGLTSLFLLLSVQYRKLDYALPFFLSFILEILPAILLLKRKRWGWWFSIFVSVYFLMPFSDTGQVFIIYYRLPAFLLILIFLLLDRKNFFKIAE